MEKELWRRRTLAIISHPDAGKTTLTEKLLLYGGALELAGSVKAKKNQRDTASDWMELEKKRGISISSTLLQFDYKDFKFNLLDTPGHKDFSEDTYRVLMAVDGVIMVIDAAKGIESQTIKLFEICRKRGIPIFTFINKMDRPGKTPLELIDQIEDVLGIHTFPINWPIDNGDSFKGVYDRLKKEVHLFERATTGNYRAPVSVHDIQDESFKNIMAKDVYEAFIEEIDLLEIAHVGFDKEEVLRGELSPVYFGSAANNFGVELLLNGFLNYSLIYGHFGFKAYGIEGAAYATLIARIISTIYIIAIVYIKKFPLAGNFFDMFHIPKELIKTFIKDLRFWARFRICILSLFIMMLIGVCCLVIC